MGKVDINNEIVLLRKNVEQARVHIVKKLTRDAHKLRTKKGTDAQKAKNLRKADRIAAEILSIKKVKRDEITKYALTNETDLKAILQNQKSKPLIRIMARIANHKKFSSKISEFKSKFPNYMEFLGPGRKKKAKSDRSEKKKAKANQIQKASKDKKSDDSACGDCEESSNESESNSHEVTETEEEREVSSKTGGIKRRNENDNEDDGNKSVIGTEGKKSKGKKLKKSTAVNSEESQETVSKSEDDSEGPSLKSKKEKKSKGIVTEMPKKISFNSQIDSSKAVSKQAVVKKFIDILKEENNDCNRDRETSSENKSNVTVVKEVDPFFVTGDGETSYLSVALPTSKVEEDSDESSLQSNNRKFSRHHNDKFFSKVPKFKDKHRKFHSNKADSKWSDQRYSNTFQKSKMMDNKGNMKSFSKDQSSKSKPFQKQSKSSPGVESESLHPSWQAKKKQQDILKQGFQGKKIVFGDDV